jgi:DNA-binding LacI/PurR family transcriptional regulator
MSVNQKQIAERLGVSIALVSRVLSGKAREIGIADATVERVLEAAKQMDYVPNAAALSLKGKATRTIGVVVYDFKDPFFGAMIEDVQAQAHEHEYSLILAGFKQRVPERSDLAPLRKHSIDGLIILGSDERADWLQDFEQMPVVRIGHGNAQENSVRIAIDEDDAADQFLRHLAKSSGADLVFIREDFPAHRLREKAIERAASRAGFRFRCIASTSWAYEAGLHETQSILASASTETILCATDKIAMGALHAMHEAGRWLPVAGFDDIPAAGQFLPPITTMRQPFEEMARRAFEAIINSPPSGDVLLKGKLIVRSSA